MRETNRSLWVAILACLSMGLFAKSPQLAGGKSWITGVFFFATLAISIWGFYLGWRGARQQRTLWSWLAPALNALAFFSFLAYSVLMFRLL